MPWALALVDQFQDRQGFLALYARKLSNSIVPMGNRQYHYLPAEAQSSLSQDTSNFGVATSSMKEEEVDTEDLPLTTIFHGVTSDFIVAVRLAPSAQHCSF